MASLIEDLEAEWWKENDSNHDDDDDHHNHDKHTSTYPSHENDVIVFSNIRPSVNRLSSN